jgi:PKD repeat protein
MNLKPWKTNKAAGLALVMIGVWVAWLGEPALALPAAAPNTVLILGSTVLNGTASLEATQATALGYNVEVASDADWAAKSNADFATYKAIVLGGPGCSENNPGPLAAAEANRTDWTPAVTGNVIVVGTDAQFHSNTGIEGATKLSKDSIAFAAAGTTTGAYISLNCYYGSAPPGTSVPVLDQFGPFTVEGIVVSAACDTSHLRAPLPPQLADLTDADLSNWFCSGHEGFVTRPSSFSVLAILQGYNSVFQAPDGTTGAPYIVTRTSTIQPPTITSFTATPTQGQVPIVNVPVNFAVTVADPTKVQSVQWDFNGDGTVDRTTTTLTTQFTYTAAGTFQAMVTVINTDGGKASATTTVTVLSASQTVDTAKALVQQLPLNSGQKNSLTSKLNDAQALMTRGNITGACGKLSEVVSQINAFVSSGQLSAADAAPVLGEVQAIQQSLDC